MKPRTAKPSDQVMRFFTPRLFLGFNSADEADADAAQDAWDAALADYHQHLAGIRERMPSPVRKLAEVCLHDAELLASEQAIEPLWSFPLESSEGRPSWSALAIFSVKQEGQIVSLIYFLWDRVREHQPVKDWPFSKARVHWLYDEVDLAPDHGRLFVHRVLLSDGRVLEIPFTSAVIHRLPLSPPGEPGTVRQTA